MTDLLLKNGRIIDPVNHRDETGDILIRDGRIAGTGKNLKPDGVETEIDVTGKWIVPGLVDMHVHLREPGREDKETIQTGCQAAVAGGFTAVACMPNTVPVNDNQSITRFILDKALDAPARVYPIAAITRGLDGSQLTDMAELHDAGVVAFSDDGRCVTNADLLRRAMDYTKLFDGLIIEHCEDPVLSNGGVMREGFVCTTLGLSPIPSLAEELMVARDIRIAEYTGGRLHIAHVSSRESVRLIAEARERGVRVSAEVTPHHLFLTDEEVRSFDTNTKMNPPLGTEQDRKALEDALIAGVIDCIATDHAPHTEQEKMVEYDYAPNGVIGLETALPLVLTQLVHSRRMSPSRMVEVMSVNPCRILGMEGGTLSDHAVADITVIDPERLWLVEPSRFYSKSRNTPFGGMSLRGAAAMTIVSGRIVYQADEE
ncbi:dihydroorotase [bacterium]|nr:dihydroorotase [candidate division CSSED10-310 bacterium]